MSDGELLAGYFGEPDDPIFPSRSFKRIMEAIFDAECLHKSMNREIFFRSIREDGGVNVSEIAVKTHTLDGRQVDCEVRIVYRGGLFKSAIASQDRHETELTRLVDALDYILLMESPED